MIKFTIISLCFSHILLATGFLIYRQAMKKYLYEVYDKLHFLEYCMDQKYRNNNDNNAKKHKFELLKFKTPGEKK